MSSKPFALLLFLASFLVPLTALGQGWPTLDGPVEVERSGQHDVAIVVGVEDYLVLPDVGGAASNAAEWEKFFRDSLGISTVFALRDAQATREEILVVTDRAMERAGRYGTIWFVFIGHGAASTGGAGLLIGADGQQTAHSVAARSVSQEEIAQRLATNRRAKTVMIVDACFSGMDKAGAPLVDGLQPTIPVQAATTMPSGVTVFTAARGDEYAGPLPGAARPAFSYLMLGAMRGWADSGDGRVTAGEALRFAQDELRTVVGRTQTPQLFGDQNLVLTSGVAEKRPAKAATAAVAATPVVEKSAPAKAKRQWAPEPVTDDFAFVKTHLGVGFADGINNGGAAFTVTPGIKFNRGKRWDVRASALLGVNDSRNALAPHIGDAGQTGLRFSAVERARTGWVTAAVGPGFAYRIHHTGQGWDRAIYADSFVGLKTGAPCTVYEAEGTTAECLTWRRTTDFAVGARFGGELPILDLAATAFYGVDGSFTVGVLAGFSIDR